jgi:hypothetical protein
VPVSGLAHPTGEGRGAKSYAKRRGWTVLSVVIVVGAILTMIVVYFLATISWKL